jgi:hypothetical protein
VLDEVTVNAAIALIASVQPQSELEALIAVQIAATAFASLKFLQHSQHHLDETFIGVYGGYATRLLRLQLELIQALAFRCPGSGRHHQCREGRQPSGGGRELMDDPMHPTTEPEVLHNATRCGARTRAGKPCRSPSVAGKKRCRMHGGAAGAGGPSGERNGNYRHGLYTKQNLEKSSNSKTWCERHEPLSGPFETSGDRPRTSGRVASSKMTRGVLDVSGTAWACAVPAVSPDAVSPTARRLTHRTSH